MFETLTSYYKRHARWVPIVFFLIGFVFDAVMLRRIDDLFSIIQQGVYIFLSGTLLGYEFLEHCGRYDAGTGIWSKVWKYREAAIHFMLGTLMNAYTIFYFKSSSVVTSFVYVGVLVVILTVTEFKKFGKAQSIVHMALWALCVISYAIYLVPTVVGYVGPLPFLISMLSSAAVAGAVYLRLRRLSGESKHLVVRSVALPFAAVHFLFAGLYFLQVIPPVPLSVSFIGIYHDVKKVGETYSLTYTDNSWKFWQKNDETFSARAADRIYCFARIFSPARFHDQINVRWLYQERGRWVPSDAIPLQITGGRENGFRGYTVKSNYAPGLWRCQIETSDNREVGRITFHVINDETTGVRPFRVEIQ